MPRANDSSRRVTKVLASSFVGSAIEFYDFMLYATAASIVFGTVFFTSMPPGVALVVSFSTMAAGYLARPLGAVLFGHFGDRLGRKRMLVLTMVLMGGATTLVGLLPTTAEIGALAPIMLVSLRIVQGVAVGGEWGGAAVLSFEHVSKRWRGFAAAFATAGGPAGAVLASVALTLSSWASGDQFLLWGWRIPFLCSAVLILVGLIIRLRVPESPEFQRGDRGHRREVPIVSVIRNHWRVLVLTIFVGACGFTFQSMTGIWGISAATGAGIAITSVLSLKAISGTLTIFSTIAAASLSDRIGRRRMLVIAGVVGVVSVYPIVLGLSSGNIWGFGVALFAGNVVVQALFMGPLGAFVAEQYPTSVRYTGASLSYQTASTLGAGLAPVAASSIMLVSGEVGFIAAGWIAALLVGIVCVLGVSRRGGAART